MMLLCIQLSFNLLLAIASVRWRFFSLTLRFVSNRFLFLTVVVHHQMIVIDFFSIVLCFVYLLDSSLLLLGNTVACTYDMQEKSVLTLKLETALVAYEAEDQDNDLLFQLLSHPTDARAAWKTVEKTQSLAGVAASAKASPAYKEVNPAYVTWCYMLLCVLL